MAALEFLSMAGGMHINRQLMFFIVLNTGIIACTAARFKNFNLVNVLPKTLAYRKMFWESLHRWGHEGYGVFLIFLQLRNAFNSDI